MAKVTLENVSKNFGQVPAVSSFHLDVEDKEFLVILGIRPEHLQDVAFPDDSKVTDTYKAVVEVVETLGAEVQLDVRSGAHNLVARVDPRTTAKRHQEIELAVNMEKIHIFETEPPNMRIKTEEQ